MKRKGRPYLVVKRELVPKLAETLKQYLENQNQNGSALPPNRDIFINTILILAYYLRNSSNCITPPLDSNLGYSYSEVKQALKLQDECPARRMGCEGVLEPLSFDYVSPTSLKDVYELARTYSKQPEVIAVIKNGYDNGEKNLKDKEIQLLTKCKKELRAYFDNKFNNHKESSLDNII